MCQQCVDVVNRHFPDLAWDDKVDILWEFTSFPFGDVEEVERQLIELKEKVDVPRHDNP